MSIASLAARLDRADYRLASSWLPGGDLYPDSISNSTYDARLHARHEAELAYSRMLWSRAIAKRDKLKSRAKPPRAADAVALRDGVMQTESHLSALTDLGPDFYTSRELIDAQAGAWLAAELHDIAEEKFREHHRQARADRRAGIVRT